MVKVDPELTRKIVYMHDVQRKGYRRIGEELEPPLGKDTVMRLYKKHRGTVKAEPVKAEVEPEGPMDEELRQLKELEMETERRALLAKEKLETLQRIKDLAVLEVSQSYEVRRGIFDDSDRMLEFAEKVMPARNPKLWTEFKEYCEDKKWEVQEALVEALGSQEDYEDLQKDYDKAGEPYSLDVYLEEWIKTSLTDWKIEDQRVHMKAWLKNHLPDWNCPFCGAMRQYTDDGGLWCPNCEEERFKLCPNCNRGMKYNPKDRSFHCTHCWVVWRNYITIGPT